MSVRSRTAVIRIAPIALATSGCSTSQSALFPLGQEAEQIALLFWGMTAFCTVVLLGVAVAAGIAILGGPRSRGWLSRDRFIVWAGLIVPAASLAVLLAIGLTVMASRASAEGDPRAMRAAIIGEQWWWRVIYTLPDGRRIESANELRIPVGAPISLELATADVIHSFWVPNLAGKLDMIPGRTNVLTLTATQPGISRGQCAEYCGGAHALMSFHVVSLEAAEYQAWLDREASAADIGDDQRDGARIFADAGCGACHAVRGTAAAGVIGPDLTHVGSRMSIAAATLPNDAEAFARWIADNQHIKPGNRMPPYGILTDAELASLANYLESLK
jgi:cytochrome c oxidase subunit 2